MLFNFQRLLVLSTAVASVSGLGYPQRRWAEAHVDRAARPELNSEPLYQRQNADKKFLNANSTSKRQTKD